MSCKRWRLRRNTQAWLGGSTVAVLAATFMVAGAVVYAATEWLVGLLLTRRHRQVIQT